MRAALGLGSNLGDRRAHLDEACRRLGERCEVLAISAYMETAAQGPPQPGYLNAAVVLKTGLTPRELLKFLQELERAAGRRRAARWGPRTLDIDLLLCDDRVVREPDLSVPHPRLHERRFVLEPLAAVAGDWVVPGLDRTVGELFEDLHARR